MIRRPPRSTLDRSSAASDVYKRQIAYELIFNKAAPGCQVVVIKNQQVVFRKAYGYFTYDSVQTVENQTMYDVASLTKIICSAPILMILNDRNLIQFQSTFSRYLPEFSTSNKSDLSIKDFMLHQGKLVSWICLLYTSDAADERSSVDLGGRRII